MSAFGKKNKVMHTAGFTLIEVLVSLSLFTIVVTMLVGTLLVLIDANDKQQNAQSVMVNMSFALDSMTREIRTGYFYQCAANASSLTTADGAISGGGDCAPTGASNFAFTESGGSLTGVDASDSSWKGSNRIAYALDGTTIVRRLGTTGEWRAITAPNVVVDSLEFVVTGSDSYSDTGDLKSPTVTVFVSGHAGDIAATDSAFNLQTTVSQQILDI